MLTYLYTLEGGRTAWNPRRHCQIRHGRRIPTLPASEIFALMIMGVSVLIIKIKLPRRSCVWLSSHDRFSIRCNSLLGSGALQRSRIFACIRHNGNPRCNTGRDSRQKCDLLFINVCSTKVRLSSDDLPICCSVLTSKTCWRQETRHVPDAAEEKDQSID